VLVAHVARRGRNDRTLSDYDFPPLTDGQANVFLAYEVRWFFDGRYRRLDGDWFLRSGSAASFRRRWTGVSA